MFNKSKIKVFEKYASVMESINKLEVPKKEKAKVFIFAVLFATLVISGALTILINLLIIFDSFKTLGITAIVALAVLYVFIIEYVYFKGITQNKIKGLRHIIYVNIFIMALIAMIIRTLLLLIGGI